VKPGRDNMQISLSTKGKGTVRHIKAVKNIGKSLLTGVKRESNSLLYLANVYTNDMHDDDIIAAVKDHGKEIGIRIMSTEIVHNRYCQDVVGCRIRVPNSHVAKAMEFDAWPDDIVCRKWEKKKQGKGGPSYGNGEYNGSY
jgi:HD superfamily phosphohydrolase YqeK